MKRKTPASRKKLPSLKIKYGSLYGHLWTIPPVSLSKKTSLSPHVYFFQTVSGHAKIFEKESLLLTEMAFKAFVFLTKHDAVEELLSSTNILEKFSLYKMLHPWLGTGLLTSHGPKWKSRRKLLTHSFHFDILKDFMPAFDEQSKILVSILKKRTDEEWIDIVNPITLCSLDIISETTLGVHVGAQLNNKSEYVAAVLRSSDAIMDRMTNPIFHANVIFALSKLGRQLKKDLECLHSFTRKVIREKKEALKTKDAGTKDEGKEENYGCKKKRKALMDLVLDVHMNSKEFTEDDVQEEIDTFAFEGHDTTSMGMSWALYLIGLYSDVQENIHQELDQIYGNDRDRPTTTEDLKQMHYLERVLKESQRLYPSVPFFGRHVKEDIVLCGYQIKKGTSLIVSTCHLHRNPEVFPHPEKFDPDRFLPENCIDRNPFAYVPFSAGPRNCIGQRFAMMEEKTVISNILRNFCVKSLEERDKVFPTASLILRSEKPLKMKLLLRNRST